MNMSPHEVESYFINFRSAQEGEQVSSIQEIHNTATGEVVYNNTERYAINGDHYWNYRADPNLSHNYTSDDFYTVTKVVFTDPGLEDAARAALEKEGYDVTDYTDERSGDKGLSIDWRNE